jgi:hypothetical protein
MSRAASAALIAAALLMPSAVAAPVTDWKQISKTIDAIPTAAGISLQKRLANCKMAVHKDTSWMETRNTAWPEYNAKPGQTVVKLIFDVPPAPVQPGPGAKPNPPQRNIAAIWIVDRGKTTALSNWADVLLNRPVPLGYDASNNC